MAAGLGFKTFTTGEVLTAADTNGYLMQGVLVFASAAARDSAITSPQEGQFAYTKDTNGLWYYDGAAWVASGATGDIEGVTAGTGISGGGTSGTVTITNSMATEITAKGDLIVGTGSATFDNLAVGTNGMTIVADSTASTGLKWATPAGGGGKVLQVVQATYNTSTTVSVASFQDTGLSLSITPTLATSKVLVIVNQQALIARSSTDQGHGLKIFRGATEIYATVNNGSAAYVYVLGSTSTEAKTIVPMTYLDSPATTSATTYSTKGQPLYITNSGQVVYQHGSANSTITLMEIGA
jgi:hypothetical protein